MAENTVSIVFQADDTSTTAAFSRLNSEVSQLGGADKLPQVEPVVAGDIAEERVAET